MRLGVACTMNVWMSQDSERTVIFVFVSCGYVLVHCITVNDTFIAYAIRLTNDAHRFRN